jgi:hypothetical protein
MVAGLAIMLKITLSEELILVLDDKPENFRQHDLRFQIGVSSRLHQRQLLQRGEIRHKKNTKTSSLSTFSIR